MKRLAIAAILSIVIHILNSSGFSQHRYVPKPADFPTLARSDNPRKQKDDTFQKVNFLVDFSDYSEGAIDKWLEAKGFRFRGAAKNRKSLELDVNEDSLILEAKKHLAGFLFNESVDVEEFSKVRIEWGIIKYPKGASYERKVNNEALMVYIFFGYDKISSGHLLVPNSPYFIGLYLCKDDVVNKPYKGRYFHKSGRFVCLRNAKPGETVISEFDLVTAFQAHFEKDEVPVISGISIAVDTSSSGDGGKAAAFIKSIEFLE